MAGLPGPVNGLNALVIHGLLEALDYKQRISLD
jgi:hypothetical protein